MKMKINNKQIKSLFLMSLLGSGLGKEEKSTNQTEVAHPNGINLNSLPQMASNLTVGKNESDPTLIFAGMPIFFKSSLSGVQLQGTSGFPVVPIGSNEDCD
jgi:hypothetical protein